MRRSKLLRLRALIELAAESLDNKEALAAVELYPQWDGARIYEKDQRVRYEGVLYRCLQGHTGRNGWNPLDAPSLWERVLIEDSNMVPQWVQPESTNPYKKGDRVVHNGGMWISQVEQNIWEPGVYGWEETA